MKIGVVAHHSRLPMAHSLAKSVSADYISVDRGELDPIANHRKVWENTWAKSRDDEWCVVLEDDALPIKGFRVHAANALLWIPPRCDMVSFYLGKLRPPQWQDRISCATQIAQRNDTCWITSDFVFHAVALALPSKLVPRMLHATERSLRPLDEAMSQWLRRFDHGIAYTWPSLVEHRDVPTIIKHADNEERVKGRVAYRIGERKTWNCSATPV